MSFLFGKEKEEREIDCRVIYRESQQLKRDNNWGKEFIFTWRISIFKDIEEYIDLRKDKDLDLLGDCCGYGKVTYRLLNYLQALSKAHCNITCLIDNHEEIFLHNVYHDEELSFLAVIVVIFKKICGNIHRTIQINGSKMQ